jgi:hypothetical protein
MKSMKRIRWSVLILVGALVMTVPLTVAEARGRGGGGGGGRGGGWGGGGIRGGGIHGGGFGHGFSGRGFARGGFRGGVVVGLGGWWNPWWYGGYWPYAYGAPGYYDYGYPAYPYGGYYDMPYAYPPAVPPAGYDYGVEIFQAPPEPPPVNYPAPPGNYYQALPVRYQAPMGPQAAPSGAPPAPSFRMPTDPRAAAGRAGLAASLQIEVTPGETEILVDGARVGMAKEFQGPVTVPVAAGAHALGFRVGGVTTIENIFASPRTTVLIKRDLATIVVPQQ